jgi:Zn-dependent protease with chaperone function
LELRLYLVTLGIQGFIWYWAVWLVWSVMGWFGGLPLDPEAAGFVGALGLCCWSASAFWWPGEGRRWHEHVGAFDLSDREGRQMDFAFGVLGDAATARLKELGVYVVDTDDLFAFVRGIALIVSRGLVWSEFLAAVLAHELGHVSSTDARLMQALDRMVLWGDPLVRGRDEDTLREYGPLAAFVSGCLRLFLRLAGGSLTLRALSPQWASYWRGRERVADGNAIALSQNILLGRYLKGWKQPTDCAKPRLLFNLQQYERVEKRLDYLWPDDYRE